MYKSMTLILSLTFLSFPPFAFGSGEESAELTFKKSLAVNKVLSAQHRDQEHLKYMESFETAWQHQRSIRKIAKDNNDLYPLALPDGEIPTYNDMGYHWGLGPAIVVELSKHIPNEEPCSLLEVGACYGFDAISLLQTYQNLSVTTVELSTNHHFIIGQVANKTLSPEQAERLTMINRSFSDIDRDCFAKAPYDLIVISKVLHFYRYGVVLEMLKKAHSLLKPGGRLVMSHMSNQGHFMLQALTWPFGGFIPSPQAVMKLKICPMPWIYYFSTEEMARLAGESNFEIEANEYTGTVSDKSADKYWFIGGINRDKTVIFNVFRKPFQEH